MKKVSDKQREILAFVETFSNDHGYSPSVREICAGVRLRSPSTVHTHLKSLQKAGLIRKDDHKTRALAPVHDSHSVQIIGKVTAGQPIFAHEEVLGTLSYRVPSPKDYFALEVRGDSMIDAGILDGDYVVVRKQNSADSGQIVVALLSDEATVKRLQIKNGEVWLMPENPNYRRIDGSDCTILGLVTAVVREIS